MVEEPLYLGMDIVAEVAKMKDQIILQCNEEMPEDEKKGFAFALDILDGLLNKYNENTCVVNFKGLDHQEEFLTEEILKYCFDNDMQVVYSE